MHSPGIQQVCLPLAQPHACRTPASRSPASRLPLAFCTSALRVRRPASRSPAVSQLLAGPLLAARLPLASRLPVPLSVALHWRLFRCWPGKVLLQARGGPLPAISACCSGDVRFDSGLVTLPNRYQQVPPTLRLLDAGPRLLRCCYSPAVRIRFVRRVCVFVHPVCPLVR